MRRLALVAAALGVAFLLPKVPFDAGSVSASGPLSRVLVAAGYDASFVTSTHAEVFDSSTGLFTPTANNITYSPPFYSGGLCNSNMVALGDGTAIVSGGGCADNSTTTNQTSIYSPVTNLWSPGPSMAHGRDQHAMVTLLDGRAMVIGGCAGGCSGPNALGESVFTMGATTEQLAPNGTWTAAGSMSTYRGGLNPAGAAVTLSDGRVLVCGGNDGFSTTYGSCEVYNPASNTWTGAGSMPDVGARNAVLLQDGRVMALRRDGSAAILWNPVANAWTAGATLPSAQPSATLVVLANGKVLVAGGFPGFTINDVRIYDPSNDSFSTTTPMGIRRNAAAGIRLNDGTVLLVGGCTGNSCTPVSSAELYDPATGGWSPQGSLQQPMVSPRVVLLPSVAQATSLSMSPATTTYGGATTPVTFQATLTAGGNTAVGGQTINFSVDGNSVGSAMTNASGVATFTTSVNGLSAGSHTTGASFTATASYLGSSTTSSLTVSQATPVISWAQPAAITYPTALGAAQLNASANYNNAPVPGSFVYSPPAGTVLNPGNSQALTVTFTPTDTTDFVEQSAQVFITVNSTATATNLVSGPDPSPFATQVMFTATVTSATGVVTQGTMTFKEGQQILADSVPLNGSGQAIFFTSTLSPGSHIVTAEYSGATGADPSSGTVNQIVQATPTINISAGTFTYDGNPHPAQASALGVNGTPVAGTFSFSYSPGGSAPPVNAGSYSVTATFTSGEVGYTDATATLSPDAGAWTSLASLPTHRYGAATAAINGKIYVASGCCNPALSFTRDTRLDIYDTSTNSWTQGAPIPTGLYAAGVGVLNDRMYVVGGEPTPSGPFGVHLSDVQVYDPATNTWSNAAPLPNGMGALASAVVNGRLYAIGGFNGLVSSAVSMYDPSTNTWTAKTSMPTARSFPGAAVQNGRIYVVGGYNDAAMPLNALEIYDTNTDTWTSGAPMPTARYGLSVEFINGTLYAVGGNTASGGAGNPVTTVELYDPNTGTWTTSASAPSTHYESGTAVVAGVWHFIGGFDTPGVFSDRHDVFAPTALRIAPSAPSITIGGGSFSYDHSPHQATGTATGVGGATVQGFFNFTYSPGDMNAPVNVGSYNVSGAFVSGDQNYYGGFGTATIAITGNPATVNVPNNQTAEAVGPAPGSKQVFFNASAFDSDGPLVPNCVPASGFTFPMGTTTVTCTAKGTNSTTGSASFTVTVLDTTKPTVNTPGDQTLEATGPGGRTFSYFPNAFDNIDGNLPASCDPPSPTLFPLGTTTVTCTAMDASGNVGQRSFKVTVRDTTAPLIQPLSQINVQATSSAGAVVTFPLPTATDAVDSHPVVTTTPASGSLFPHGNTQVIVTATDFSNNTRTTTFTVHVEASLVSIDTKTDDDATAATINVNQTKQFVAVGHFTDGSTQSTADNGGGGGGGGGSTGGGGGSTGGAFWNVHFSPGLNVSACGTSAVFSSQAFSVDATGLITNSQWSPQTPSVNVTGQLTTNTQTILTLTCLNDPSISTTATLLWQGTSFDGQITFSGVQTSAHVTGWSSQPAMPTAAFATGAATVGNKLYIVGGGVNGAPSGLVQVFNLATRSWEAPAASLLAREGPGVAALNGFVYAAGGHMPGGDATNTLQRYDPALDQWTMLAPMHVARAELQLVAAGGMLYAIGGEPGNGSQPPLATVERYNPGNDTWTPISGVGSLAPMSTPRAFFSAGALNNGATLIAVGMDTTGGSGPSVELYDIASNTWSPTTSLPLTMSSGGSIANRFYVASQCGTFVYRPVSGTQTEGWAIMPSMVSPRSEFSTVVVNDVLYAAGGFTGSGQTTVPVTTFDALSTPATSDLFYSQSPLNVSCPGTGGSGGGDNGGDQGPTWHIVDSMTGMDSSIASIDASGLATGLAPGTALVVAEFGGISCLDTMTCATLTVERYATAFSGMSSHTVEYGTGSVLLSGHVEAPGPHYPADETISVTVNGASTPAVVDANGNFSATIDVSSLTIAPYAVTYSFGGSTLFAAASDSSTFVTIVDTTPPTLTLLGANPMTIEAHSTFVDPGATATDIVDGNLTAGIHLTSDLNTNVVGTYQVVYSVSDHAGNTQSATRVVNVIDTTPPTVTASATPSIIWPASGRLVAVTVSGQMTDAGSGIDASTASFQVADEYGVIHPSGLVSVAANGSYSFTVMLEASRRGSDADGRTYQVAVSVSDHAGNTGSAAVTVRVPHDQGK